MVIFKDLTIKCGWHNCPLGRRTQYILSPVRNFYDVPSELRLYRLRYLPLFQSKCNVLERPHHPAAAEESKVSAALLRWVLRKFCRERRKASAFLQVQQNRLRLFFCFHKDVACTDFFYHDWNIEARILIEHARRMKISYENLILKASALYVIISCRSIRLQDREAPCAA